MSKDWIVIVVEDTYDDLELISTVLSMSGIEVHVAKNGEECLGLVQSLSPTFIITDLAMPQMDGWEMLNALRKNPKTAAIPVVAISAYYSSNVAVDAYDAGFAACFPKPVRPRQFIDQLAQVIDH